MKDDKNQNKIRKELRDYSIIFTLGFFLLITGFASEAYEIHKNIINFFLVSGTLLLIFSGLLLIVYSLALIVRKNKDSVHSKWDRYKKKIEPYYDSPVKKLILLLGLLIILALHFSGRCTEVSYTTGRTFETCEPYPLPEIAIVISAVILIIYLLTHKEDGKESG